MFSHSVQEKKHFYVSPGHCSAFFFLCMTLHMMKVMMSVFAWLLRKPDPMKYGVMDNPDSDRRAEVSCTKMSNQSQVNSFHVTLGFLVTQISFRSCIY